MRTKSMSAPWAPVLRYVRRNSGRMLFRKFQPIHPQAPLISFTFDDFPRSALLTGGEILKSFGASGTYYTALGLLGKDSPSGQICVLDDLKKALEAGHELGCHTYSHCDSWYTAPREYEQAILQNRRVLTELIPEAKFESFSFPLSSPRPTVKRAAARHFLCCRGGGQTLNVDSADLNQLSAYFLEKADGNFGPVKALIDRNAQARGWIIFATHDVSSHPSPYGCTPQFFEEVLRYAAASGAQILPVVKALKSVQQASAKP
jgi:peptidoglycan/xylan/chitin deacetylase (PgdA/CDA1 family)